MAQTKTPSIIQKLRESHQALARGAAASGIIPLGHVDDPAFLDLVEAHREKSSGSCLAED